MAAHTRYSKDILGARINYDWRVRFDLTTPSGCLGITQWHATDIKRAERVLLSRGQVRALLKFLRQK